MEDFKKARRELGGRTLLDHPKDAEAQLNAERQQYEAEAALVAREHPEVEEKIRRWLESIDSNTVLEIFEEYLSRSGVSLARMNVPEQIYLCRSLENGIMSYDGVLNSVQVNVGYFQEMLRSNPDELVEAEFMRSLFHEFAHATGYVNAKWHHSRDDSGEHRYFIRQFGLDVAATTTSRSNNPYAPEKKNRMSAFTLLNEGITEQISHEVMQEYLRRAPHGLDPRRFGDVSLIDIETTVESGRSDYDAARRMVGAIAGAIAKDAGVSGDLVWRGFVRQYYSGEMTVAEARELLAETLGRDAVSQLAQATSGTDLRELALSTEKLGVQYPGIAKRWLEHLATTRGAK